jgi:cytochrome c
MKSIYALLFVAFFSLLGTNVQAQNASEAYFLGKWNVSVKGTPNGDVTLPGRFEKNGVSLKGFYTDPESKEEKAMTGVEIDGAALKMSFSVMGYDITITITKKDENTATGSLMDMFEVVAVRVV